MSGVDSEFGVGLGSDSYLVGDCNVVEGCTDPNADNYNSDANIDDGSCTDPCQECFDVCETDAMKNSGYAEVQAFSVCACTDSCEEVPCTTHDNCTEVSYYAYCYGDLNNDLGICSKAADCCYDRDSIDGSCPEQSDCSVQRGGAREKGTGLSHAQNSN